MPGWQAELLSDALLGFGAQSVVVEEFRGEGQQEQERFGAEAELWDSCRLLAHFAIEVCADGPSDVPLEYVQWIFLAVETARLSEHVAVLRTH